MGQEETPMRVLIVGGTGLISTAFTRLLLEEGHAVTLFNRGKTSSRVPPGAEVLHGDRKDYAAFEAAFADKTYDVVVDMVAFHPDDSESAVRAFGGRAGQFLHCSTVCVYSGPVTQIPTTETEAYHSIGSYGQNKIACEKVLLHAHETSGFPVTIMRPSHSYGEGGSIIRSFGPPNRFITRMRQDKPIVVQGDGQGLWASCHVDDVARGFRAVMGVEKCLGEAYHITGDEWMTWAHYYEALAEVCGGTYAPVHIPTEMLFAAAPDWAGGTREIFAWPSIFVNAKLKRDTDYDGPRVSFRDGMARNLAWLESEGSLPGPDDGGREDILIASWQELTAQLPRSGEMTPPT